MKHTYTVGLALVLLAVLGFNFRGEAQERPVLPVRVGDTVVVTLPNTSEKRCKATELMWNWMRCGETNQWFNLQAVVAIAVQR